MIHKQKGSELNLGTNSVTSSTRMEANTTLMFNISRTIATAITYSIPIILLGANSALADRRDFTAHNSSRLTIEYLYVSDSSSNNWGSDILGDDTVLAPGESTLVYFMDDSSNCLYDIRAVAENGAELIDREVNLCEVSDYYITD